MSDTYEGPVVFVDGVHYPATVVEEHEDGPRTHADLDRPLRWDADTNGYRDAVDGEPLHNDVYEQRTVGVSPHRLEEHPPGQEFYPVGAHVVTADGETYFLAAASGRVTDSRPLAWDAVTESFVPKEA